MAKYNITEIKEKKAAYRSLVSPKMMDQMQEQIMNIIVMQISQSSESKDDGPDAGTDHEHHRDAEEVSRQRLLGKEAG